MCHEATFDLFKYIGHHTARHSPPSSFQQPSRASAARLMALTALSSTEAYYSPIPRNPFCDGCCASEQWQLPIIASIST